MYVMTTFKNCLINTFSRTLNTQKQFYGFRLSRLDRGRNLEGTYTDRGRMHVGRPEEPSSAEEQRGATSGLVSQHTNLLPGDRKQPQTDVSLCVSTSEPSMLRDVKSTRADAAEHSPPNSAGLPDSSVRR